MGANIEITIRQTLPITVQPARLGSLTYTIPVASAQVKSALLLAGLASKGVVRLIEPVPTRNHTELMLQDLGVDLKVDGQVIELGPGEQKIAAFNMDIPGDPSSAAFPAAMASLLPECKISFKNLLLNPTRMGFFHVLKRMGAKVSWKTAKTVLGEEVGTLTVESSELRGILISGDEVPTLIDEIPVLAILASRAKGETVVRDAGELRLKECDRIKAICENLRRMGTRIQELADGFRILGPVKLRGATISTYSDHRIAMAFAIAGRLTTEKTNLDDPDCVNISFPGYHELIAKIAG
ncbi:MAG: 3-phosphoshikimate 1-carboxyvinyltransferase, partial [Candidatus Marinimicrobia bacterium]|nr:3-phosphoshikimate 1-carboxyvinyltransferase [Candidatus Neomarinimicrobiota bacterium]